MSRLLPFCFLILSLVLSGLSRADAEPPPGVEIQLASAGQARMAITLSPKASATTRRAADDLAEKLQQITGATFAIDVSDSPAGITLGTCLEFPQLAGLGDFQPTAPFRRDAYLLRSHAAGLYLIGASDIATQHAVWDLLHRLGYRLYFLTDTWEIIPKRADLRVQIDTFEHPDFVTREGPRGSPWSNRELWQRWRIRNRVDSAFDLNTGHSYDGIIARHAETFKEHPEYLTLNGKGTRGGNKFCISNPDLRRLVVDDAIAQLRKNPKMDSVSLDPSDGDSWCTCQPCAEMGSVSDRVVLLANQTAVAINELGLGPKYVGIYGYSAHSIPPSVAVHPHVVVSLATSFIRGGNTIDTMVSGWSAAGAVLGIREYHDVFTWSHDLPHKARGGTIPYLVRTIPTFYANNARFMNSECSDSWAANGLGYWLTPQLLWDTDNAAHADELVDDFLTNCFGPAKEPMRELFERFNYRNHAFKTAEDDIARFYRLLKQGTDLAETPEQMRRLEDLILYVRYIELYYAYRQASARRPDSSEALEAINIDDLENASAGAPPVSPRQAAYNALCILAIRMQDRYMISTRAIIETDRYRDDSVTPYSTYAEARQPEAGSLDALELPTDPITVPINHAEVMAILQAGIAANEPVELDFEPMAFSDDLVATRPISPDMDGVYRLGDTPRSLTERGSRSYLIWLDKPGTLEIGITGGLISHYRDRGNIRAALFSPEDELGEAVSSNDETPPDGKEHIITLTTPHSGFHRLVISDGHDKTRVTLPMAIPLTLASGLDDQPDAFMGKRSISYFYVPKGTPIVGGFSRALSGYVHDGDGTRIYSFADMDKPGFFSIPVPAGQDGRYWQLVECSGYRHLMTVPPYLAQSPESLLIPREVLEADQPTLPQPK